MKKRSLTALTMILLVLSLSSCGKKQKDSDNAAPTAAAATATATPTAGATVSVSPAEDPTPTATPEVSPTPEETPFPGSPFMPAKYSEETLAKMLDDDIPTAEYAYEEVTDFSEINVYPTLWNMTMKNTETQELGIGDPGSKLKYNHRIRYRDADLQVCAERYLLDSLVLFTVYHTKYGDAIDFDGYRYYDFQVKETDDAGRTVLDANGVVNYYYHTYNEEGRQTGWYHYFEEKPYEYITWTYDSEGRLSAYTEYGFTSDSDVLPPPIWTIEYTYDASGNCINKRMTDLRIPQSIDWYNDEFVYEKDAHGRLIARTVISTDSYGASSRHTDSFKYYSNGPILIYSRDFELNDTKAYDNLIVFLPDETTKHCLLTCSNLNSAARNAFDLTGGYNYSLLGFYVEQPICCTAPVEHENGGIGGFLRLPKAEITGEEVSLMLLLSLDYRTTDYLPRLLAADVYDDSVVSIDRSHSGDYKASYQVGDRIYITSVYDSWSEVIPFTMEFDESHRLLMDGSKNGKALTYDDNGRITGWTSTNGTDSYYIGYLYYDEDGKLSSMNSTYTDKFDGHRETTILTVY